jgi:hypothetical protein
MKGSIPDADRIMPKSRELASEHISVLHYTIREARLTRLASNNQRGMLLQYGIIDAPANMGAASKLLDALLGNKRRRVCDAFAPKTPATPPK